MAAGTRLRQLASWLQDAVRLGHASAVVPTVASELHKVLEYMTPDMGQQQEDLNPHFKAPELPEADEGAASGIGETTISLLQQSPTDVKRRAATIVDVSKSQRTCLLYTSDAADE